LKCKNSLQYIFMKISYYLNEGRKKNLYCRISDGTERTTFSLEHTIDPKKWNAKKEEEKDSDIYYYTLLDFKKYLANRYHELKAEGKENVLTILKNEATTFLDGSGIKGIARKMFDLENKQSGLPKYDNFLQAFEKHSNLKKDDYKAETVGEQIHFHINDRVYQMDTYEGKTAFLRSIIDGKSYDEIYTMTNEDIWSEIYVDAGIEKHIFLPKTLSEWENYWNKTYQEVKENIGRTEHLDKMKQESWRKFQVYMECYDSAGDAIKLAYELEDSVLYPLAVITMMQIFDAETCYQEYCELEFDSNEWESISFDDDEDWDSPVFYIRPYEI